MAKILISLNDRQRLSFDYFFAANYTWLAPFAFFTKLEDGDRIAAPTPAYEGESMDQLLAQCPMRGCGHKNRVCTLRPDAMPTFDPGIYVVVKCSNCGQEFRELAARLESSRSSH
jgi:hypothetical protein